MIEYILTAPNITSFIIITSILIVNTYSDLKFKEIEFKSLILMVITVTLINFINNRILINGFNEVPLNAILGAVIGFAVFFVMALFFGGGGGDAILAACLGWCIGTPITTVITIAYLLYIVHILILYFIKKYVKGEKPFVPYMFFGWISTWVIYVAKMNTTII